MGCSTWGGGGEGRYWGAVKGGICGGGGEELTLGSVPVWSGGVPVLGDFTVIWGRGSNLGGGIPSFESVFGLGDPNLEAFLFF